MTTRDAGTAAGANALPDGPITGGEALARMLLAHGIGPLFGMGGFQLLPFYDACRRLGLSHALINDERCGAFAADAYARVTGRVGVCDATLGPGATNLVTALVESYNAGVPIVAIVGDTHRDHSWKNMTQETRQLDILRPVVKEVIRVERTHRIPELVRRAFAVATSGRPGPVLLDVPEDVAHDEIVFQASDFYADPAAEAAPSLRCRPASADLARAADLLAKAERPVILAGGGVHLSQAAPALEADVILAIGCKLGEIATKRYSVPPAGKTLIHLDILAEEFDRCYPATVRLWGDAREGIEALTEKLAPTAEAARAARAGYATEIGERMAKWRAEVAPKLSSDERPITMARLMTEVTKALPADGLLVADGGFAAHWGGLARQARFPG